MLATAAIGHAELLARVGERGVTMHRPQTIRLIVSGRGFTIHHLSQIKSAIADAGRTVWG